MSTLSPGTLTPTFSVIGSGIAVSKPLAQPTQAGAADRDHQEMITKSKIVIVDDEEINILFVKRHLKQFGYHNFFSTVDSTQAMSLIHESRPDVVLLDVRMPKISGLEILAMMRNHKALEHIPAIALTACSDSETKLSVLKYGPSDFLSKPVDPNELLLRMRNVLTIKAYHDHAARYSQQLEQQVAERTAELQASRQQIIHCLARAAEFRDDDTGNHVVRVGRYAAIIADELGFTPQDVQLIEQAAQLHDIGKIGVEDAVLLKDGKLDPEEFDRIKQHCGVGRTIIQPLSTVQSRAYRNHTDLGASLLESSDFPIMKLAASIAQTHHEKWDGSGYPLGLAGEDIPIEGRITAVADVFDALSSKRPYKPAFPREKCFEILREGSGVHFDPRILEAFFARSDQIVQTQIQFANIE